MKRNVKFYNLDAIISVGFRVNSKRAVLFRIWANKIVKDFLVKGFAINEKRLTQQNEQLKELQDSVKILGNVLKFKNLNNDESIGLLKIITDYAYALDILDQYDYQTLKIEDATNNDAYKLTYEEAMYQISVVKTTMGNSTLFG